MDKQVLRIAWSVRTSAVKFYDDLYLGGKCYEVSKAFTNILHQEGLRACLVVGSWGTTSYEGEISHCWVELDSKIIDLTATQFGSGIPAVYIPGPAGKKVYIRMATGYAAVAHVKANWMTINTAQRDIERRIDRFQTRAYRDLMSLRLHPQRRKHAKASRLGTVLHEDRS